MKIGLALGSGAARGLAHVGVIRALARMGIKPHVVAGASSGSLVGAAYACGQLDAFEQWAETLTTLDVMRLMDINLVSGSGLADGTQLINHLRENLGDPNIEQLSVPFTAVATEMESGREVWLQEGPLWDAIRASMALPGILSPVHIEGRWLVDGGLVNPVPVSVCKAMGADTIIAVNLNNDLVTRVVKQRAIDEAVAADTAPDDEEDAGFLDKISQSIKDRASPLLEQWLSPSNNQPGLFNVMANSINIMQDRITRSRLAGEPADIVLSPRLGDVGMLEFNRAKEIIAEGAKSVTRVESLIAHRLGL